MVALLRGKREICMMYTMTICTLGEKYIHTYYMMHTTPSYRERSDSNEKTEILKGLKYERFIVMCN